MKIGIFDSGRGGEYVADDLRIALPHHEYVVVNDRAHVPYGSRGDDEIVRLTDTAIQPLIEQQCDIIVIACNTATMAALSTLRATYPSIPFVGIEPMIKPAAALSNTHRITVLATPLTLKSERYRLLKQTYGGNLSVDEPSTAGWAAAIEYDRGNEIDISGVAQSVQRGSDVIVLACTHYHTLRDRLREQFPDATILEPTAAVGRQIERLVQDLSTVARSDTSSGRPD